MRSKIVFFVLIIMSICSLGLSIYFFTYNLQLQKAISQVGEKANLELKARMIQEREFIRRDLDEKYRADMVSYQATVKRLELEKKRAKELQDELKRIKLEQ